MATKRGSTTIVNANVDKALEKMDRDGADRLVVNEIVGGKAFTLLEIERKVGPLAKDNQNNVFC